MNNKDLEMKRSDLDWITTVIDGSISKNTQDYNFIPKNASPLSFGDKGISSLSTQRLLTILTQRALLSVSGSDAHKLLQGQLTADISLIDEGQASLGALCTPKGKIIGNFLIHRPTNQHDTFLLSIPSDNLNTVYQTLKKYAVFYQCEIDYCPPNEWVALCFNQIDQAELDKSTTDIDNYSVYSAESRTEILINSKDLQNLWLKVSELPNVKPVDSKYWTALDMLAGQAWIHAINSNELLPHQLNFQLNHHINFKKGCYTGQEIIARTEYRGKIKRRMFLLVSCTDTQEPYKEQPALQNHLQTTEQALEGSTDTTGDIVNLLSIDQQYLCLVILPQETKANDAFVLHYENKAISVVVHPIDYENLLADK